MKIQILRFCLVVSCLLAYVSPVKALEWWEKVEYLTYSPRYFGPNAFPIPELVGGSLSSRWEVELRGEYHKTRGDLYPFVHSCRKGACRGECQLGIPRMV